MKLIHFFNSSSIPEWSTPLLGIICLLLEEFPISDALFDISSPPLVAISHSCTFGNNPSKKYWHWCHCSYTWCGHFKSSPLNLPHVSKNCSSSLWVNSEIFLRIALVLCTGKYLFKNFITICSHNEILLAGNVFNHERALSFKENRNNLRLTSSSEKFSYLNIWQMAWKSFKWLYGSSFSRPQNAGRQFSKLGFNSKLLAATFGYLMHDV